MFRLFVSICLGAGILANAAYVDPASAKILKEQRFNSGDGRFGSAYAQEDGVIFREETSQDGERLGQYSYIDLAGKTITVKYSAGKDGFKILEGNHVPIGANGQLSATHQAAQPRQQFAPAPVQQAAQAFQPRQQSAQAFQPRQAAISTPNFDEYDYDYDTDGSVIKVGPKSSRAQQVSTNPFINPDDPTHRNFQYNTNAARFDPNNPITKQLAAVPDCAGCKGVNPFINPFDSSHQTGFGGHQAGHQAGFRAAAPAAPAGRFQSSRFADYDGSFAAPVQRAAPVQQAAPAFRNSFATQAPKRFFPPGKLDLNRYENGFSFDFSS